MRLPVGISIWVLLAFSAAALPPAPEAVTRDNLLRNPGFEEGTDLPAAWDRHPAVNNGRNAHARDTAVRHGGQASGRLTFLDPIEGPNQSPVQWMKYGIPVEGGAALLVGGRVRTDGVAAGRVGVHVYDGAGGHLGFHAIPHPPGVDSAWQPFEQTLVLPREAARVGLALYAAQGGATWYDDVTLLGTPTLEAARGTPALDGVLDDPVWAGASPAAPFVLATGQALAAEPARAWAACDDEALYVAFDCPWPPGPLPETGTDRREGDSPVEESVEVCLDPEHAHQSCIRFRIDVSGAIRDSRGGEAGHARAAVRRRRDGWSVEAAFPFSGLDLTPATGAVWGINLARHDRAHGQTAVWSLGGLDQPARFGNLRLDPDLRGALGPAARRELEALATRRRELADALGDAGLTAGAAPEAFELLAQAGADLEALGGDLAAAAPLPWSRLRARLEALGSLLDRSRRAAVQAAYAGTSGAPFAVRVAGSLVKIPREGDAGEAGLAQSVRLHAARDECESFQVVLIPGPEPCTVRVESAEVSGPAGRLPLAWHPVGYVETAPPKGYSAPWVGAWPDILLPPAPVTLQPGRRQPLWFRVSVPPDAAPGQYRGSVVLSDAGGFRVEVPVELRVWAFRLPRPGTLACPFGLYAQALSHYYHGKRPYAEVMPPATYRRWVEFMGEYRLTPKNVATEYVGTRAADGANLPDLSTVRDLIADIAPGHFPPYSFEAFRLPCPPDWQKGAPTSDPEPVLRRLAERVAEYARLGLPPAAYIYGIDEPAPEGYPFLRSVYERAHAAAPGMPLMQTVNHAPPEGLAGLVDIWCPLSARLAEHMDFYRRRREAGDTLWLYVCCAPRPPYANFFVDEPAIDHRVLFWQARQAGAAGVLYWCVCWWYGLPGPATGDPPFPQVPIRFSEHLDTYKSFGTNGDGLLVWPGPDMTPYPSLRLEVVRDGIEDYEYLALLDRCLAAAETLPPDRRPDAGALERARAVRGVPEAVSASFTSFTRDPAVLLARREAVGRAVEELTAALGREPPPEPCVRPR